MTLIATFCPPSRRLVGLVASLRSLFLLSRGGSLNLNYTRPLRAHTSYSMMSSGLQYQQSTATGGRGSSPAHIPSLTDRQQRAMVRVKGDSAAIKNKAAVAQKFDFFLVLDFEATCDNEQKPNPQEIIEFPVLKFNARSQKVDSIYHHYVLPQHHPHLTPFCSELTGIVQEMVNGQPHLPQVLQNFDKWMMVEDLLNPEVKSIFVTCGDWDLQTILPKQCALLDIAHKFYFHRWINIKKSFADVTGTFPKGLMNMLTLQDLKHIGRHHSGIDDCHNICNVLSALLHKGYIFKENGRLSGK